GERVGFFFALGDDRFALRAVPHRKLVAPPDLARNVPIANVLEPRFVGPAETFGDEADAAVAIGLQRGLGQRSHRAEPLQGEERLDDRARTRTDRDGVPSRFGFYDQALLFEIAHDRFAGVEAIQILVRFGDFGGHFPVDTDHARHRKLMALADFVVERIVWRGDLDRARSQLAFHRGVGDD